MVRNLCAQTEFTSDHLIQPLFLVESLKGVEEIVGLAPTQRQSLDAGLKQIESDLERGIHHFLLFVVPREKSFSTDFAPKAIAEIKMRFGSSLHLWVDTCLCSTTADGHCYISNENRQIDLPNTLSALTERAFLFAQAGADGVCPSDMMDLSVLHIRKKLDESGFDRTLLMSYSTKFASQLYGPFRSAADSAPQFGDRKHYQIDVRNRNDAILSSLRCAAEGADFLMVKPAMTSIDLISEIHERSGSPVGAYQVSGEFASIHFLAKNNFANFNELLLESWQVLRRAGAQFIISYGARLAKDLGIKTV